MNKILRIVSTLVVGIGLILLFVYLAFLSGTDKLQALNQPSYYTVQNYWYLLLSGCGCIAFSIVSCFLAWNKNMDEKVEVLPNAVGAERTELLGWLSGSSLDTGAKTRNRRTAATVSQEPQGDAPTLLPRHVYENGDQTVVRRARRADPYSNAVTGEEGATVLESTDAATVSDSEQTCATQFTGMDTEVTQYTRADTEATEYTRLDNDATEYTRVDNEDAGYDSGEMTEYTQSTVLTSGTMTVLDDDDNTVLDNR